MAPTSIRAVQGDMWRYRQMLSIFGPHQVVSVDYGRTYIYILGSVL